MALRITLGDLLHRCADRFGDRPFLTIAETGKTLAYGEFESIVNRLAHGIEDRFGEALSYVAIFMENGAEYLATSYALKKIDAIEVSINHAMRGAPLARMIDQTEARLLFTSGKHLDALDRIRDSISHVRTLVLIDAEDEARRLFPDLEVVRFEDILSDRTDHLISSAKDTDTATILFTSGTTGVSKGCLLSHRYAVRTAENIIDPFKVTVDDCVYSPYPLSHIGPAYYDILPTMMTGGRVVLRQRFSVSNFWPEVKKYEVTWFMMLGSVQQLLWANPPCPEEREHRVTRCWSTPAPVPKKDFDARFGVHLIPGGGYGSTDAGWVVVPQWDHPGGVVLPHFEVAIHDDAGDPVPLGEPGQMVVRPLEPGVMSDGYFSMPDRTLASRKDLWFHTGDIARLDENNLFYFMHRMSERIRVKGEMVSAYEVEEGALAHVAVQDCAAIGVQSEWGEEAIKLFVVKKPGFEVSADELKKHCADRMARFMVPEHIVFLDELPRTSTGKPEKGKLAAL
ncbi:AMP-binding protein [Thioalkalivibrio sp. HK1]|uniref:AMP-binding protein n=1 Tax=Thioalkalivibrio sp. HK1 TaxID=1469245 RepID=UPI00047299FB|nr:AMP-binding protein [Thioalkalivibrio sp. HK1]